MWWGVYVLGGLCVSAPLMYYSSQEVTPVTRDFQSSGDFSWRFTNKALILLMVSSVSML